MSNFKRFKRVSALLALTLCLSTEGFCSDLQSGHEVRSARVSTRAVRPPLSSVEQGWWKDFRASKKDIVVYVDELASRNSKAASWFLLTGGKYGYSDTLMTPIQERHFMSALNKVVIDFIENSKGVTLDLWFKIPSLDGTGTNILALMSIKARQIIRSQEDLRSAIENSVSKDTEFQRKQKEIESLKASNSDPSKIYKVLKESAAYYCKKGVALCEQRLTLVRSARNSPAAKTDEFFLGSGFMIIEYILESSIRGLKEEVRNVECQIQKGMEEWERIQRQLKLQHPPY
jgi:hypothetical protein